MSFFTKLIGYIAKEFLVKRLSQSQTFRRSALEVHSHVEKTTKTAQEAAKALADATAEHRSFAQQIVGEIKSDFALFRSKLFGEMSASGPTRKLPPRKP